MSAFREYIEACPLTSEQTKDERENSMVLGQNNWRDQDIHRSWRLIVHIKEIKSPIQALARQTKRRRERNILNAYREACINKTERGAQTRKSLTQRIQPLIPPMPCRQIPKCKPNPPSRFLNHNMPLLPLLFIIHLEVIVSSGRSQSSCAKSERLLY